ncbi:TRAP transporter small permease [Chelativorans sp. AA-79]|uniref:TRAP transporter small permease subunit n=1 Tax=Chelativorans sp. AA-79 TaxID=3028735 RepID=UPI0023F67DDA|nr:TRAP transporter small permease [Chelativorans sp. AA-79]WEX09664.1 TRAP transporter small permease [Chelativorans sp. AA-79]
MKTLRHWLDKANNAILAIAFLSVALMMVQVTADVLSKYLFNRPIPLTLEAVASFYMVALIFLPLGLVTRDRGHVGVDLFTRNLPPRGRAALDAFGDLLGAVYAALLLWFTAAEALHQTRIGETWETAFGYVEIWPARWLVPLGCLTMLAWFLLLVAEDIRAALGGDGQHA